VRHCQHFERAATDGFSALGLPAKGWLGSVAQRGSVDSLQIGSGTECNAQEIDRVPWLLFSRFPAIDQGCKTTGAMHKVLRISEIFLANIFA
jgi:hypothetical protein